MAKTAPPTTTEKTVKVPCKLMERYRDQIAPAMVEEFHYKNVMQVPRLKKVVVNIGAKEGNKVQIMETRPLSKTKRWRLVKVLGA